MNFFGQKEEKPAGPDPLFAGACLFFVVGGGVGGRNMLRVSRSCY
jgi:hypothetical protein